VAVVLSAALLLGVGVAYSRKVHVDPFALAQEHHRARRYDDAIAAYVDAARRDPRNPWPHFNLGMIHAERNRFAEARQAYEQALALAPDMLDARLALGLLYHRADLLDDALREYVTVASRDPRNVTARYNIGLVHQQKKAPDRAIAAYREALAIDPGAANVRYNLGYVLAHDLGRWDDAIAEYERAVAARADYAAAWFELGVALDRRGLSDRAQAAWRKTLELDPRHEAARARLGAAATPR
jgi:tetratricopeptide (TPR) repeat protein